MQNSGNQENQRKTFFFVVSSRSFKQRAVHHRAYHYHCPKTDQKKFLKRTKTVAIIPGSKLDQAQLKAGAVTAPKRKQVGFGSKQSSLVSVEVKSDQACTVIKKRRNTIEEKEDGYFSSYSQQAQNNRSLPDKHVSMEASMSCVTSKKSPQRKQHRGYGTVCIGNKRYRIPEKPKKNPDESSLSNTQPGEATFSSFFFIAWTITVFCSPQYPSKPHSVGLPMPWASKNVLKGFKLFHKDCCCCNESKPERGRRISETGASHLVQLLVVLPSLSYQMCSSNKTYPDNFQQFRLSTRSFPSGWRLFR